MICDYKYTCTMCYNDLLAGKGDIENLNPL